MLNTASGKFSSQKDSFDLISLNSSFTLKALIFLDKERDLTGYVLYTYMLGNHSQRWVLIGWNQLLLLFIKLSGFENESATIDYGVSQQILGVKGCNIIFMLSGWGCLETCMWWFLCVLVWCLKPFVLKLCFEGWENTCLYLNKVKLLLLFFCGKHMSWKKRETRKECVSCQ